MTNFLQWHLSLSSKSRSLSPPSTILKTIKKMQIWRKAIIWWWLNNETNNILMKSINWRLTWLKSTDKSIKNKRSLASWMVDSKRYLNRQAVWKNRSLDSSSLYVNKNSLTTYLWSRIVSFNTICSHRSHTFQNKLTIPNHDINSTNSQNKVKYCSYAGRISTWTLRYLVWAIFYRKCQHKNPLLTLL